MATATVDLADPDPNYQFHTEVEMDNPHIDEMCWSVRRRNVARRPPVLDADGKPVLDENGQPTFREFTNAECFRIMLGQMLAGWSSNAALDRAEDDRAGLPRRMPGTWTVIA